MNTSIRNASLLALAALAGTAHAQTVAHDGFDYPTGAAVVGQTGGTGFSTPWQSAGYGGWTGACTGMPNIVQWKVEKGEWRSGAQSSSGGLQRSFSTPIAGTPGTSVWVSFTARQTGPTSASWLGVKLPCTGPGSDPFLFIGKPFGQANWGVDNGSSGGVQALLLPAVQKVRCVARIDFRAGRDDVTVWTNPALDAEPSVADAGLHLPAYGNFADIRKVLLETGSTGGTVSSSFDALRIGSTYAEVSEAEVGHVLDGFHILPAPGSGTEVVETLGAPKIRVYREPGALGCDASVAMNSAEGGSVTIGSEAFAAAGGEIKIKHKGWDGLIYHRGSARRSSDGSLELECDLTGTPTAAVRTVVTDGTGTVILDETDPGPLGYLNINGPIVEWGPCPDGSFPEWVHTWVFHDPPKMVNNVLIWMELVSVYMCPGSGSTNRLTVTNYGICDAGVSFSPGLASLEVSSPDLPFLDVSGPAVQMQGASVSGTGDVLLSSVCGPDACDSSPPCDDPAARRVRALGIGSSGQDGVEVKWPSTMTTSGQFTLGDLHLGSGQATAVSRGIDSTGVERDLGTITFEGDNGRTIIRPDFSAIGATGFTATGYDATGTVVYQEVFPNGGPLFHIICGPNAVPQWGWVTMWVWNPWPTNGSYQTHWGVTGCAGVGSGNGNPNTSTERVIITPLNPVIEALPTGVNFSARGTSELEVFNIISASADTPCPADFNHDGFIDFFDYDDFVLAYETGTADADVNGDGFLDFFDYDDFVLAYEVGC